jgi:CRP-like cAMP-binding protein
LFFLHDLCFLPAGLNLEAISAAARSMEEIFLKKGDVIIYQDDIGDSFYVLEEGMVSVTVRPSKRFVKLLMFCFF